MRRHLRRVREVELFNFSFLDILACVIGLLIFILSIVVISSGGSGSQQSARRVSDADHQLQRARAAAVSAAQRRAQAEQTLGREAKDFANPVAAADAVRARIKQLDDEQTSLLMAAAAAIAKRQSLEAALAQQDRTPSAQAAALALVNQLRDMDRQTAHLAAQADEIRKNAATNAVQVQYHVPRQRDSQRGHTLWVEVSRDRLWVIDSDDYAKEPLDVLSTTYSRRPGAAGVAVSALVNARAQEPPAFKTATPNDTVLEVALHSDGYMAFRVLRKWAWAKGYAVNWHPQDGSSITLTRTNHAFEQ